MKAFKITVILFIILCLIAYVRSGNSFPIIRVLPFLGGRKPGIYDIAGIIMIVLTIRALRKLKSRDHED